MEYARDYLEDYLLQKLDNLVLKLGENFFLSLWLLILVQANGK